MIGVSQTFFVFNTLFCTKVNFVFYCNFPKLLTHIYNCFLQYPVPRMRIEQCYNYNKTQFNPIYLFFYKIHIQFVNNSIFKYLITDFVSKQYIMLFSTTLRYFGSGTNENQYTYFYKYVVILSLMSYTFEESPEKVRRKMEHFFYFKMS